MSGRRIRNFSVLALLSLTATTHAAICTWTGTWDVTPDSSDDAIVVRSGADLNWTAALPPTVASWTQEDTYTGTVTIETVYGTVGFTNLAITGDCVISNGVWTHKDNSGTETNRLKVTVGGRFELAAAARIDAVALGYDGNTGLGNPTASNQGGAHGGIGGKLNATDAITTITYGSITEPVTIGSGGAERPGGGAIHLSVGGAALVDGTIDAGGQNLADNAYKGAGGSIFLRAASLAGAGTLQARGGSSTTSRCGGGGGRIAVQLTGAGQDFSGFAGGYEAYGGTSGSAGRHGGAGTVYLETAADTPGQGRLIIDNNGISPYDDIGTELPSGASVGVFSSLVLTNAGRLVIDTGASIDFASVAISGAGASQCSISVLAPGLSTYPIDFTLAGYTLADAGLTTVTGNWTIASNGALTYVGDGYLGGAALDLTVDGNLTIEAGGRVHGDIMGYAAATGPGGATTAHDGGAHGGVGGAMSASGDSIATGFPYDEFLTPSRAGSGAYIGQPGGGIVLLAVTGVTHVAGEISVNGGVNPGSAGGTIRLTTGSLTGGGTIRAQGGDGVTKSSGSGGRVSVVLTDADASFTDFTGAITAYGGHSTGRPDGDGAAGSVYLEGAGQATGGGDVIIDNTTRTVNLNAGVDTELPPSQEAGWNEDLRSASFQLRGNARLRLTGDAEIGDLYLEAASVVDLAGYTLTVHTAEHALDGTVVSNGGALVWMANTEFSISDASVVEGGSGTTTAAVFTVTLSAPLAGDVTFDVDTLDGTAAAPGDYTAISGGSGVLKAGDTVTNVTVTVQGDDLIEGNETFTVVLSNPMGGATLGTATGTGTIINDDARTLSVNNVTIDPEGDAGQETNAVFTVTLSEAINTPVTFQYATADGSATAPDDYTPIAGGSGTIPAGATTTNITVIVKGDDVNEGISENFALVLSNPSGNATLGTATGTCTIVDDDGLPLLAVGDVSGAEGDAGPTPFDFIVSLNTPGADAVSFDYATFDGTAVSPSDYAAINGTGTIAAGALQTTVTVHVAGDVWIEGDETFMLVISNAVNAAIMDATGTAVIVNDDHPLVWTGLGGTGLASDTNNWSRNGTVPPLPPSATDEILLDGTSVSNMTWDAPTTGLTDAVLGWTQTTGYTGRVTFPTTYPAFGTVFTNFLVTGDCVISNGTWTHLDNAAGEHYRLHVSVGGDVHVGPAATLSGIARGYDAGQGPGAPGTGRGGAHGGMGGYYLTTPGGTVYGSITEPIHLGSGGASGPGGGAILLRVVGTAMIEGSVDASGRDDTSNAYEGAGGSVYVRAGSLAGGGAIRAEGGDAVSQAGGGGGRVAVALTGGGDFSGFTGTISAAGGSNSDGYAPRGQAGTVYLETTAHAAGRGELIIDNGDNARTWPGTYTVIPAGVALEDFASVLVTNYAHLAVPAGASLDFDTAAITWGGATRSFLHVIDADSVAWPAAFAVDGFTLDLEVPLVVTGNWTVASGGVLTHRPNGVTAPYAVNLTLQGDLSVDVGGRIDVSGRGYIAQNGPGGAVGNNDGGGYGGMGGNFDGVATGFCYGSYLSPTNSGSGSEEQPGGGRVWLAVSGTTRVDGEITAVGEDYAGAAGGGISLRTGRLEGNGFIRADGGGGLTKAAGGGGRVAVRLTEPAASFSAFTGTLSAYGGDAAHSAGDGAAGSVYLETVEQSGGKGVLHVNNPAGRDVDEAAGVVTQLPPAVGGMQDSLRDVELRIEGSAQVRLGDAVTVGDVHVDAGGTLYLQGHVLTVRTPEHALDGTVVTDGGRISWLMAGSLFLLK